MSERIVSFTEDNIPEFILLYNTARNEGEDSFTFEEHEFSTAYAKYLIDYLAQRIVEVDDE